jgi:hypothetical protein
LGAILNLLNTLHTLAAYFPKMHNISSHDAPVIFSLLIFQLPFNSNMSISLIHSPLNTCQRSNICDQPFLSVIFEKLTSQLYEREECQAETVDWDIQ